jgi:hypothetical protein
MKTRQTQLMRFVMAIACGAFLATVAVFACDKEAPKSGTVFCDQNLDTCATSNPVLDHYDQDKNEWIYSCADKNIVNKFPSGCKTVEAETNCTEEQAQCSRPVDCVPNAGNTACVDGDPYGQWDWKPKKVSEDCE